MSVQPVQIADRLNGVSDSATLRLNAAVQALKAQGVDVVNLTAGEPDFSVPEEAKQAAIDAIRKDQSKYTPVAGLEPLRQLIADKTNAQQPALSSTRPWTAKDVVVSNGGKQAIFNAILSTVNPGDEVLIPAPYWLTYPEITRIAGGKAVFLETSQERGYRVTAGELRYALKSGKVRALFLNSPSNPTGAMYTRAELAEIGDVLSSSPGGERVVVISDEIYDRVVLGDRPFVSFLQAAPQLRDRVVTINGMSKSAAMTGWRIGWSVADARITGAISALQGQSTSGINSIAQWASIAALKLPEASYSGWTEQYAKRRAVTLEILSKAGKLKVFPPEGAFYVFADVGAYLKPGEDSFGFCERVLAQAQVALIPGTPFGAPTSVRLSFATSESQLRSGCQRWVDYLEKS